MKKKRYFIPQVDILLYRTDDLCDGGGELMKTSSETPKKEEFGGFGSAPARKLYI